MNLLIHILYVANSQKRSIRLSYLASFLISLYSCHTAPISAVDSNLIESIRWYTGEVGTVNDKKAKQLLELAAADEDTLSTMWLARVYSTGRMGYPADKPRAQAIADSVISDVEAMANAGVSEAQFLMGTAYAEALGKVRSDTAAADWYRRAADSGHILAAHNMGNIHFSGTGVVQDDALTVFWWTQAAQAGDAIPQYRLAQMFEQGRGVEMDLEQAISWYKNSARRGNTNAKVALERLQN
ncbi:MAG: sel1 repeat family protein [Gammaproteobacteria bacterium]|nr:sel1 repeat family protein [Gammaproteobacteria bacterium]